MNNSWNSTSWDEDWLDEYKSDDEKLRDIAEISLSQDPACDYGIVVEESLSSDEIMEVASQPQSRKVSRGRKYSNYLIFTKEEATRLFN